jgi:hypothetical protein
MIRRLQPPGSVPQEKKMTEKIKRLAIFMLIGLAAAVSAAPSNTALRLDTMPAEELNLTELEALTFMAEEEKLARDVYLELGDLWNLRVFENIASAEQQHIEAVQSLRDRYEIDAPETLSTPGVFQDPHLQDLFDSLVEAGSQSPVDALLVGATIEDVDIADLEELLEDIDNSDITMIFDSLIAGSENHMRAFIRQLDREGEVYEPQYITEARYLEIL